MNRNGTVELAPSRLVRVRIPGRLCAGSHRFALGCITGTAVSVTLAFLPAKLPADECLLETHVVGRTVAGKRECRAERERGPPRRPQADRGPTSPAAGSRGDRQIAPATAQDRDEAPSVAQAIVTPVTLKVPSAVY